MAANYIEMPVDGAGKKVQTWDNTISGNDVHTEAVTITDSTGTEKATSANPVRIDPTGTTVQPVDGALTNNNAAPAGTELGVLSAVANAAAPTWVEGNQVLLSVDLAGNQRVKIAAGTAVIGHVIVDSGTITTVSTVTSITNPVTVVGNAASGAAVAGNPVLVGGSDGTDARTISTNASGQLVVVGAGTAGSGSGGVLSVQGVASGVALPVSGTFYQTTQPVSIASGQVASGAFASGSIASGAIASGAIASGAIAAGAAAAGAFADGSVYVRSNAASTFPVTATIAAAQTIAVTNAGTFAVQDTVLDAALIAQETTTSGVKGLTVFGAVTTSAPTYTTAKSDALSLDTAGNLRVLLNAETTKVIGTVNQGTSPWVISGAVTLASTTITGSVAVTGTFYQATQPVSIASGQIASGAIASGAVAAGAFVSGSILSGALASGAVVDLTNVTSALAATAPTKALAISTLAATSLPTAVTGGQAVLPMTDKFGRQVVLTAGMRDILAATGTTITSTTSATPVVAAVASTYCDITSLTITNSSATATLLTLSDGTNSYIFSAAGGPGWGVTIPFNPPLPAASVNTAWTLTCGTSVSSVYVVAQYIKNH